MLHLIILALLMIFYNIYIPQFQLMDPHTELAIIELQEPSKTQIITLLYQVFLCNRHLTTNQYSWCSNNNSSLFMGKDQQLGVSKPL